MYQHIMLPLDGSELSLMAVPQAIALAKALRSRMTLITVVSPYHTGVTTPITSGIVQDVEKGRDEEARKEAQKMHGDISARAKSEGIQCESLVVIGDSPYALIIENAGERKCDLIVMASHGRRGMDAILVASETVKVLTHSKIPVLVVR